MYRTFGLTSRVSRDHLGEERRLRRNESTEPGMTAVARPCKPSGASPPSSSLPASAFALAPAQQSDHATGQSSLRRSPAPDELVSSHPAASRCRCGRSCDRPRSPALRARALHSSSLRTCLRMSPRSASLAGVCCRPRVRLCRCRLPCASYTASSNSSSSNNSSTTCIHGSHNSATCSANQPSRHDWLRVPEIKATATSSTGAAICPCEFLLWSAHFCTEK